MMLHVPNVLTREQVAHCRRVLEAADWEDGNATSGPQAAQAKRNRQLPLEAAVTRELGKVIAMALARNATFLSAALPHQSVPPLFNRYEGGEHFGLHIDNAIRPIPGSLDRIRTDLSSTLFFSDPEEYDGGELVVVDTYGMHEVKLPAGDMILYPSSSLHRVEPVTRGVRFGSFFWTQSIVRDDTRRGLLFELDVNIQKLRARIGDTEEVIALTGHYHNLLRQWAEL
ncbi:Fe2+-dependent dioxygenase [Uliginosibacterium sp. H1]|uniref:Fe2+-dependent dioxygenase n=1 Tax=Uliginosibacterium sp. H1 TaxID=3114757 RepID=UPI002E16DB2F|nr:Fe2+-dependent dioxygenase [Uliginosibacterium sp. H1]